MSLLKRKLIISSFIFLSAGSFAGNGAILPEVDGLSDTIITGNIIFRGNITDSSCEIFQKDKEVDLGNHSVAELKNRDDKTNPEPFDISVMNCSLAMTSLKITMNGTPHKDNAALYTLDAGENSAGNVGISITTAAGQQVMPGTDYTIERKTDSRDYTLSYNAAYQATGLTTPGTGNATVNYTVSYE